MCLKDLPCLHLLYDVMVAMFSENYDEMLEKTAKKRAAREKIATEISNINNKNITLEKATLKEANL